MFTFGNGLSKKASKTPLVYIIIINWNSEKDTIACLDSVFQLEYIKFKVVVVDNGSSEKSRKLIKRHFPEIVIIENGRNLGFTGGNNIGINYALQKNADYVWLLNSDSVVERSCLSYLIEYGECNNEIGLLSPRIFYFEKPELCQWVASFIDFRELKIKDISKNISNNIKGPNICLWGTALLIKRRVLEKIGILNEKFFAYWEDTEYCLRALKSGFNNGVVGKAIIYHKHQLVDENGKIKSAYFYYYMFRNRVLLGNLHIESKISRVLFKIQCIGKASEYVKNCNQEYIPYCLNGLWHGLIGVYGQMSGNNKIPKIFSKILIVLSRFHPEFITGIICLDFRTVWRKIKLWWITINQ